MRGEAIGHPFIYELDHWTQLKYFESDALFSPLFWEEILFPLQFVYLSTSPKTDLEKQILTLNDGGLL